MENEKSKIERCLYCHMDMIGALHKTFAHYCVKDGWDDDKAKRITKEDCENCSKFDSKYIEYPLTINGIDNADIKNVYSLHKVGRLCEISPCGEEYKGKSFLGIYLGDLPISIMSSYSRDTGILKNSAMTNPAIFVPELKKIIYGCSSWWRVIDKVDDFKGITKEEIENTWYVQLLKSFN